MDFAKYFFCHVGFCRKGANYQDRNNPLLKLGVNGVVHLALCLMERQQALIKKILERARRPCMAGSLALERLAVDNIGASRFDDQQLVGTVDVFPPVRRAENVDNITVALFVRVLVLRAAVRCEKVCFNFKNWKKKKKEKKKKSQKKTLMTRGKSSHPPRETCSKADRPPDRKTLFFPPAYQPKKKLKTNAHKKTRSHKYKPCGPW